MTPIRRHVTLVGILCSCAVGAALIFPHVMRVYHLEVGGRAFEQAEAFRALFPDQINPALDRALSHFQRAAENSQDGYAYRRVGQAWLLAGDNENALNALKKAVELRPDQPLIHIELGYAYDGLGQVDLALAEYERGGYGRAAEAAIANYLKLADWQIAAGGTREALRILQDKVLQLDRNSVPALYRLLEIWESTDEQGAQDLARSVRQQLQRLPLGSLAVLAEPRLAEYRVQAMLGLVDGASLDRTQVLNWVSSQGWQPAGSTSSETAERVAQGLLERWPQDPDVLFTLADLYHRRGDLERAAAAYQRALVADPSYGRAYDGLGRVAEAESKRSETGSLEALAEAAALYERYQAIAPRDLSGLRRLTRVCAALEQAGMQDVSCRTAAIRVAGEKVSAESASPAATLWASWLEQVATVEPEYPVGQELDNGWTLQGYDADEAGLIRGAQVDLLLYWTGPASQEAGLEQDGWVQAGERWVQVLEDVRNLVSNGGFEAGTQGEWPAGFPEDIYDAPSRTRRLVADSREASQTTVAVLENLRSGDKTSFASARVAAAPEKLYLQTGWIKSTGGKGYLRVRWGGRLPKGVEATVGIIPGVRQEDWRHYAGVLRSPQGTAHCQVILSNYEALGQVFFDQIALVEIGTPGR